MNAKNANRGEFALINYIRQRAAGSPCLRVGIGDDCAVIDTPAGPLVITTDMTIEGVHFLPDTPLRRVGWKAAAVSFSDVAAMGLAPEVLVCAAALPARLSMADAQEILLGLNDACQTFGVALAGGDTDSTPGGLSLCTTVIAHARGLKPVLRSGARIGDAILVTGSLGGSILGRHLAFTPRVAEAVTLNTTFALHAMIDISDGLSADLNHILEESKTGAIIDAQEVPVSDAARQLAKQSGKSPLQHALSDGEDFELLFTMDRADARKLIERPIFDTPVAIIGEIVESGLFLRTNGKLESVKPQGYEHLEG